MSGEFSGQRVVVMGLGRFGGGVGVTRWLAGQGASVVVTDVDPEDRLRGSLGEVWDLVESGAVRLRLGGHVASDFRDADVVVVNPAVPRPWDNGYIAAAREGGARVTTEIGLVVERVGAAGPSRERVIGVTGTAGKSTTTAMIGALLEARGVPAWVGGNIGGSLLGDLGTVGAADLVVLELSSAQLWWLGEELAWSPGIAVVTGFAPNHLDWHGTEDHYLASKRVIIAHQAPSDVAVFADARTAARFAQDAGGRPVIADASAGARARLRIPGEHNRRNAATAVTAACIALQATDDAWAIEALSGFVGLPHRLAFVGEFGGVRCYDDSKCTTPEAAALALAAFDEAGECGVGRVHLICGGYDKGVDLGPMLRAAAGCAGVHAIGATAPAIVAGVLAAGGCAGPCGDLARAVEAALSRAAPGDVLLLSPGCASWDQFENFVERGETFARLVRQRGTLLGE